MKGKRFTSLIILLVCLGLMSYMVVFSVSIDEVAVHYRFGRVIRVICPGAETGEGGPDLAPGSGAKVVNEAGWYFKLPWPCDKVQLYDQRIRHTDGPLVQTQLPDGNQIIPRVYITWRLKDPVAFQKSLQGDIKTAEKRLKEVIGNEAQSVFGSHNLEDVVNTDRDKLQFAQIEAQIFKNVRDHLERQKKPYGIEITSLGISWIALPQDTTVAVFERMKKERMRQADALKAEGNRIKRTIIAAAQEERAKIITDAEAEAKRILAEGEAKAAEFYHVFAADPELAIFLRRLESFKRIANAAKKSGHPLQMVISTKSEPFTILDSGPLRSAAVGLPELKITEPAVKEAAKTADAKGVE